MGYGGASELIECVIGKDGNGQVGSVVAKAVQEVIENVPTTMNSKDDYEDFKDDHMPEKLKGLHDNYRVKQRIRASMNEIECIRWRRTISDSEIKKYLPSYEKLIDGGPEVFGFEKESERYSRVDRRMFEDISRLVFFYFITVANRDDEIKILMDVIEDFQVQVGELEEDTLDTGATSSECKRLTVENEILRNNISLMEDEQEKTENFLRAMSGQLSRQLASAGRQQEIAAKLRAELKEQEVTREWFQKTLEEKDIAFEELRLEMKEKEKESQKLKEEVEVLKGEVEEVHALLAGATECSSSRGYDGSSIRASSFTVKSVDSGIEV